MKNAIGIQKRRGRFVAYLTHPDGKIERRSIGPVTLKTAISQRGIWVREIAEGKYVKAVVKKDIVLFSTIADAAVQHAKDYNRTWDSAETRAKVFKGWFGPLPVGDITTEMINKEMLAMVKAETWSERTSDEYRTWLVSCFDRAKIVPNPAKEAHCYKSHNTRHRPLTDAEEPLLRAAIRKHYPSKEWEFDLLLHTGARCSNWYGQHREKRKPMDPLMWKDVDLAGTSTEAVFGVTGIPVINFPRSKGGDEAYTVPINSIAVAALMELMKLSPDGKGEAGPVIRKKSGLEIQSCKKWFAGACAKAGIVGLTPNQLRHTFAARLRKNRVAREDRMALMGHDLRKGKERIAEGYAPPDLEALRDAVATLVPKPFLVGKPAQAGGQTGTKTGTADISEIQHAATA